MIALLHTSSSRFSLSEHLYRNKKFRRIGFFVIIINGLLGLLLALKFSPLNFYIWEKAREKLLSDGIQINLSEPVFAFFNVSAKAIQVSAKINPAFNRLSVLQGTNAEIKLNPLSLISGLFNWSITTDGYGGNISVDSKAPYLGIVSKDQSFVFNASNISAQLIPILSTIGARKGVISSNGNLILNDQGIIKSGEILTKVANATISPSHADYTQLPINIPIDSSIVEKFIPEILNISGIFNIKINQTNTELNINLQCNLFSIKGKGEISGAVKNRIIPIVSFPFTINFTQLGIETIVKYMPLLGINTSIVANTPKNLLLQGPAILGGIKLIEK
jgi:hypothetical protein